MKKLFKTARKGTSNGDRRGSVRASSTSAPPAHGITTRKEWIEQFIAFSCGTGSDDWEGLLAVADECARNADAAKTAMKSLRQEFQLGVAEAQTQATRILVILWRNSGEFFRQQAASKKFLQAYEAALKRADPELHALMLKALMVLSYEAQSSKDLYGMTQLYNKHKNPSEPVNGLPLPEDDATFHISGNPQQRVRARAGARPDHSGPRDLWKEAEKAKSRAKVLSETLSFTPPHALDDNELIHEFYAACQKSQSIVMEGIPYASQQAEEAAAAAASARAQQQPASQQQEQDNSAATPETNNEERLLALLMEANEELTAAFAMFDDAHRRKRAADEEREVHERSLAEQRMPSRQSSPQQTQAPLPSSNDPYGGLLAAPFASSTDAAAASSSSSRGPSPSPSLPPQLMPGPFYSHEPESYNNSSSTSKDPFNPDPPMLGPYHTPSAAPQHTSSASPVLAPAAAAATDSRPPSAAPQEPASFTNTSAEVHPEPVTVTRRGSKLMSNNPFASAIHRERQGSSNSSVGRSASPSHLGLSKLQLSDQTAGGGGGAAQGSASFGARSNSPASPSNSSPSRAMFYDDSAAARASPSRSVTDAIPEDAATTTATAPEPDRNPFHQQLAKSTSSIASGPPASPASYAFNRPRKPSAAESIVQTPTEPSAKAMGKLRRYSGMYGSDVDEANRAEQLYRENEERLRERYVGSSGAASSHSGHGLDHAGQHAAPAL